MPWGSEQPHSRAGGAVSYIAERFGVEVAGREITETDFSAYSEPSNGKNPALQTGGSREAIKDSEILIERYSLPTAEEPDGRLEIVAAGKLLYLGPRLSQRRTRRKKVPFRQTGLFKASRRLFRKQRRRSAGSRSAGV